MEFESTYLHRALTGRCYKTNRSPPGEISRMSCIFKIEVTASVVPSLCSFPCDYYPSFWLFKGHHCDLFSLEFGLFLCVQNIRRLMISKHYICGIGKLAEKLLFHSLWGSLMPSQPVPWFAFSSECQMQ